MDSCTIAKTAHYWSEEGKRGVCRGHYHTELGPVVRRQNEKVSRDPGVDWVEHTLRTYFADRLPVDRCLSLGCGRGWLEPSS